MKKIWELLSNTLSAAVLFGLGGIFGWQAHERHIKQQSENNVNKVSAAEQVFQAQPPQKVNPPKLERKLSIDELIDQEEPKVHAIKKQIEQKLKTDKNDPIAHFQMAKLLIKQQQVDDAIVWFVDAKQLSDDQDQYDQFNGAMEKSLSAYIKNLTDFNQQIALFNKLQQLDGNNSQWYFLKAQLLFEHHRYEEAKRITESLRYQIGFENKTQKLLDSIQKQVSSITQPIQIPLIKQGNHYLIEVAVNGQKIKLLLDTGATLTVIDSQSEIAEQLMSVAGLGQSIPISTAGGLVEAQSAIAQEISLVKEKTAVNDLEVALLPLNLPYGVSGLLGMNYLQQFKFQIDDTKQSLFIKR